MTDPAPDPQALDQAVIDAGRGYATALMAAPLDPAAVDTARQVLEDARTARGYADA